MKLKNETRKLTIKDTSRGCDPEVVLEALEAGQTLNDAAVRKALGLSAIGLNAQLAEQMNDIMSNRVKAGSFAETFFEQINTDEEPYEKIGYYMAKAIRDNNVEDLLVAICGWSSGTLIKLSSKEGD